jgi:hypothetical protein
MTSPENAGQQFNCRECGKPQFTAEFGFEKHNHSEVKDPCIYCGDSTAPGLTESPKTAGDLMNKIPIMNPKFINRVSTEDEDGNDAWACADCGGFECDKCDKPIRVDEDVEGPDGYGHYHEDCAPGSK